jgi:hypothetical protein
MFGSYPNTAWKYGTEEVAISMNQSTNRFSKAYSYYRKEHGFKILLDRN